MIGYLGLGSNVGERREHLQFAVDRLPVIASSSVYETEPVGEVLDQRPFLNACVQIEWPAGPEELLDACKAVEVERGRVLEGEPGYVRHGPRALDVDVLLLGDLIYESPRLVLPHREASSRRFVLVPLLELAPTLVIPGQGAAADLLASADDGDVRRAGGRLGIR